MPESSLAQAYVLSTPASSIYPRAESLDPWTTPTLIMAPTRYGMSVQGGRELGDDGSRFKASQLEASQLEASQLEASQLKASQLEASQLEAPLKVVSGARASAGRRPVAALRRGKSLCYAQARMEIARGASLLCHPSSPYGCVRNLKVRAARTEHELHLTYSLYVETSLERLLLPKAVNAGVVMAEFEDRLWQHTCFEAFLSREGETSYQELNFSPSRQWAAYAFRRHREKEDWRAPSEPHLDIEIREDGLELRTVIPIQAWFPSYRGHRLRLGISAVIEDAATGFSYWALRHPTGRPDFHHPDCFAMQLDAPRGPGADGDSGRTP